MTESVRQLGVTRLAPSLNVGCTEHSYGICTKYDAHVIFIKHRAWTVLEPDRWSLSTEAVTQYLVRSQWLDLRRALDPRGRQATGFLVAQIWSSQRRVVLEQQPGLKRQHTLPLMVT